MEKAQVTITIIRTDSGSIRIKFQDGGSYLIRDTIDNIALNVALEVELDYALNKKPGDENKAGDTK